MSGISNTSIMGKFVSDILHDETDYKFLLKCNKS